MSDDGAKAEEERIQRAMNRKNRVSLVVQPSHRVEPFAPVNSFTKKQPSVAVKPIPTSTEKVKPLPLEKPKPIPSVTSNSTALKNSSSEIESLQLKKRTIIGTIGGTRRELEEVRSEIAKLKNRESELVSLLEKREAAVHQLISEIEIFEQKDHTENLKRKEDDEKSKRAKDEMEKRRKEEADEERKKIEEEDKKIYNPQPLYSPRSEEELNEDGLNAEELRIMRAMSRPGKIGAPISGGRKSSVKQSSAVNSAKPAMSEADKQRIYDENRKKEEEQRASQERDLQQRIAHLQQPGGVKKTFSSSQVYDFDAEVKFIADFTNFEEIPITTSIDNNFTYTVTWNVNPGFHFYLFKINGKTEINKNIPTGLAPNGSLMNKIEC